MTEVTLNPTNLTGGYVGFQIGTTWYPADPGVSGFGFAAGSVGSTTYGGLVFADAGIPQGETINSASLQISGITDSGGTGFTGIIGARDEDDAAEFSGSNLPTSGTYTTATSGQIAVADIGDIDLTSVIQELVDRAGWTTASNIALLWARSGATNGVLRSTSGQTTGVYNLVVDYGSGVARRRVVLVI